jgi:hypothetical protein
MVWYAIVSFLTAVNSFVLLKKFTTRLLEKDLKTLPKGEKYHEKEN